MIQTNKSVSFEAMMDPMQKEIYVRKGPILR